MNDYCLVFNYNSSSKYWISSSYEQPAKMIATVGLVEWIIDDSFLVINYNSTNWHLITSGHDKTAKMLNQIRSYMSMEPWPEHRDMEEAKLNLARLQYVYQLDPLNLARGIIGDRKTRARLLPDDLHSIGKNRIIGGYKFTSQEQPFMEMAIAIEWLEAAHM